jgi:hypothetical protein
MKIKIYLKIKKEKKRSEAIGQVSPNKSEIKIFYILYL